MGNDEIVLPEYGKSAFNCPHCGAYADQFWSLLSAKGYHDGALLNTAPLKEDFNQFAVSKCRKCERASIWIEEELEYPKRLTVSRPNKDLPEDIKKDYLEAASILQDSPRGAAALLRLCIQKLCKHLGQKGENINDDTKSLVEQGLPSDVQKAMDILRVTGNDAVHPGKLNLNDNPEIAYKLFKLVNFVAEKMITEPRELSEFYDEVIPEKAREAIKKRDKK